MIHTNFRMEVIAGSGRAIWEGWLWMARVDAADLAG
jgi:hypothetical protein